MKRHASLLPLSHDHHHTLVAARRLRTGATAAAAGRTAAAETFLRYFSTEIVRHFRQEEEQLFPLLVDTPVAARELLVRALLDHQELHALARTLQHSLATSDEAGVMRELAEALERHTRFEERELFPLLESTAGAQLAELELAAPAELDDSAVVRLLRQTGRGPVWGTQSEDLNATLLVWRAGHNVAAHVNSESDVLLVAIDGSVAVTVEERVHVLSAGDALMIPKGVRREVMVGPDEARYLTVHGNRGRAFR